MATHNLVVYFLQMLIAVKKIETIFHFEFRETYFFFSKNILFFFQNKTEEEAISNTTGSTSSSNKAPTTSQTHLHHRLDEDTQNLQRVQVCTPATEMRREARTADKQRNEADVKVCTLRTLCLIARRSLGLCAHSRWQGRRAGDTSVRGSCAECSL